MNEQTVGSTRAFVLGKGVVPLGSHTALVGHDETKRLLAELHADPDRPEVRVQEAYHAILSSMQPGWTLRLLQLFWPDPAPRFAFHGEVVKWVQPVDEGLIILYQGLHLFIQEQPLPYFRRTILEFVLPGDEGIAWWEGVGKLCQGFGIHFSTLSIHDISVLTGKVLNLRV